MTTNTPFRTGECHLHDGVPYGRIMVRCEHFGDRFVAWSELWDGNGIWLDFGDFEGNTAIRDDLKVEWYEPDNREKAEPIWHSLTERLRAGEVPQETPQ